MGPDKRPKKFEERQRAKVRPAPRVVIPTGVVIRERVVEAKADLPNGQVPLTGQLNFDPKSPSISVAKGKNKGVYVGPSSGNSQGDSETPTDPEILELLEDLKVTATNPENVENMPTRKINIEDCLQVTATGVGQSSITNKSPTTGRQKISRK